MRRLVNPTAAAVPLTLVGGAGALAASAACCVLPLGLGLAGLGGAWLSVLGPLAELRPLLLGVAVLSLIAAWAFVLRASRACAGGDCAGSPRRRPSASLTAATALTGLAAGWDWIEPPLMAALFRAGSGAA